MRRFIVIALLIYGIQGFAQESTRNHVIDSLNQLLQTELPDSVRMMTLRTLSRQYKGEQAAEVTKQALDIAKSNGNTLYVCKFYIRIGSILRHLGDEQNKNALKYFDSTLYILETNQLDSIIYQEDYNDLMAVTTGYKADDLTAKGKTEEALELHLESLARRRKQGDKSKIASSLLSVGTFLFYRNKMDEALDYYLQGLELAKEEKNEDIQSRALTNVGIAYGASGDIDKAIEYFELGLAMAKKREDLPSVSSALGNLSTASIYKKDYQTALKYAVESEEIAKALDNVRLQAHACESISSIYHILKDYKQSIEYLTLAIKYASEIGEKVLLKDLYENATNIYVEIEKPAKALEYQSLLIEIKDSLFNEKSNKQITEMQTKYETQQKEQENELLKKESEVQELQINRQKITIYVGSGGLILIISLAVVIFRSYRQKKQDNIKLMEKNAIIRAKTKEIHKKNQQITDSIDYAQRIQQAVLPDKQYIESIFPESFIFFRPKDRVSGDFYWMHKEGDQVLFAAADCTGHGVPGAFMSLICTDLLNNIMLDGIFTPSIILEELGTRLVSHLKQKQEGENNDGIKDALDIALCNYNTTTKELVYSGAHNSLYLVRDNELKEYKADKLHIGIDRKENSEFTNHSISTQAGDIVYMFSDGFVDQQGGEKGKKFYYPPFRKLLLENHTKQMEEQKENLRATITNWMGEKEQIDDMLVFGIKF